MLIFLKLFLICCLAGFFATSLMWIFFWAVGVFEVPQSARKLFGVTSSSKPPSKTVLIGYDYSTSASNVAAAVFCSSELSPGLDLPNANRSSDVQSGGNALENLQVYKAMSTSAVGQG